MPDKNKLKNGGKGTFVGNFLRGVVDVAPELLNVAGAVTGIGALKELGNSIKGSDSLSEKDKEIALEMLKLDIAEAQEVTKRWEADTSSRFWLPNNIRPIALAFLTVSLAILIVLDSALDNFTVENEWIDLLSSLLLLIYAAYFGGRSLEKIQKIRK
tara:strand:+ start:1939 stop:2409 length:471 start_codon:yes stop_codon:yes gene_type:complete